MSTFLICDDEVIAQLLGRILRREGVDCPDSAAVPYAKAAQRITGRAAGLIVAVLPADPIQCLEALEILAAIPRNEETQVIAVGPAADAKLVIRALRGIVDDYVDREDVDAELVSVLRDWRRRRSAGRPEGRFTAVLGPSGGAGASTIAASLAVSLAKVAGSAALIDLKLESGDQASLLDLKPTHSLADVSQYVDRLDRTFFEQALVRHSSGVHLLSPTRMLADVESVTAEGVRQSIGFCRALFPAVVADVDHSFREEQMQALRAADLILMVLRLDFASLRTAKRFLDHFEGSGIMTDKVRLVVNRLGQAQEIPRAKVEATLGLKVFHAIPEDAKAANRAMNIGVPVVLDAPSAKISRAIVRLAADLKMPEPVAVSA